MGGRGASLGISARGNKYGTQFHAIKDEKEKKMVERAKHTWYDYLSRI